MCLRKTDTYTYFEATHLKSSFLGFEYGKHVEYELSTYAPKFHQLRKKKATTPTVSVIYVTYVLCLILINKIKTSNNSRSKMEAIVQRGQLPYHDDLATKIM